MNVFILLQFWRWRNSSIKGDDIKFVLTVCRAGRFKEYLRKVNGNFLYQYKELELPFETEVTSSFCHIIRLRSKMARAVQRKRRIQSQI